MTANKLLIESGNETFSVRMMKRGLGAYLLTEDCQCLKHMKYYAPQLKVIASITKGIESNIDAQRSRS